MKFRFWRLFLVCFLLLLGFEAARACSCAPLGPCLMNARADAVFIGKVVSFDRDGKSTYEVAVEKIFGGLENISAVDIHTDRSTSCAYSMDVGETYLIFAGIDEKSGRMWTHYCSGTKKVANASKELGFLESLKNAPDGQGVLRGSVTESDQKKRFEVKPWRPKEIDAVSLVSETGESFEARLAADGSFAFENLKGGFYRLSVNAPARLIESRETSEDDEVFKDSRVIESRVKVPGSGCSVERSFSFRVNGVIAGRVFDAGGRPLEDIPVTLFRYDDADSMPDERYKVWTNAQGDYLVKGLPPARYMVGFGINEFYITADFAAFLPVYFPRGRRENEARFILLGEAQRTTGRDLQMFPQLKTRKIVGRVVDEKGNAAPQAEIVFHARRKIASERWEGGYELKIDAAGVFELDAYEETEYFIHGWIFKTREGSNRPVEASSSCFEIAKNGPVAPLTLVMKPGKGNCDTKNLDN